MEQQDSSDHSTETQHERQKGGLITMPFIIANEAFEKVSSYGLLPNMIFYLMKDYRLGVAKGTNVLFFWTAASNFTPLLGAFISDSYLGRFLTIGLASVSSLLGMIMLWLTAMIPQAKPSPCNNPLTQTCKSATGPQMSLLVSSFALISIGAGGIRPCSLAFGADQLDNKDNPKNERVLESFFGWYYASASVAVLIAFTIIIYIQEHLGWKVGFGIPVILMFFAGLLFFIASPFYVRRKTSKSLLTGFAQVIVSAYKNRDLCLPAQDSRESYYHKKDSELEAPTEKLRFLNKACVIRNREQDIASDGSAIDPWNLCTTQQVEELKALIKVIPLWSTSIMMSINTSQTSFQALQAKSMDRHIGSSFQIPAGSFGMFTIVALALWVVLYDRAILPLASKLKGKPVRLSVKLRMGMGLFLSFTAMVVSASVESVRRKKAIQEGLSNNPTAVIAMSAMWLAPQYILIGLAEALTAIGQTEFFYSEFPKSMSSIASSLFGVAMGVASLLASFVLSTVNRISSRNGKEGWISDNINNGHYDLYYWVLAVLSFVNVLYYLLCSWAYGPSMEELRNSRVESNRLEEEELEQLEDIGKRPYKEEPEEKLSKLLKLSA